MSVRPWIALLLLFNYLLVVGMGCVDRPEDTHELIQIQTQQAGNSYQQCRYMRMDGLEAFLAEAMASHYQNAPTTPPQHLISVVTGINSHYLPSSLSWQRLPSGQPTANEDSLLFTYRLTVLAGVCSPIYTPPWRA